MQHKHNVLVTKTVGKEGADASTGSAIHMYNKSNLHPITLRDENKIVLSLQGEKNPSKVTAHKVVF